MWPVVINIVNRTRFTAYLTFSCAKRGHVWPEPGRAYVVGPGQAASVSLLGYSGERVYFSAQAGEAPGVQWGRARGVPEDAVEPVAVFGAPSPVSVALVENQ